MAAREIIKSVVNNNLKQIKSFQDSLNVYLALGPFSPFVSAHKEELHELNEKKLPHHLKKLEEMLLFYRFAPPLITGSLPKMALVGCLNYFQLSERYANGSIGVITRNCIEELNGGLRELNQANLQQKQLRNILIDCRNAVESSILFREGEWVQAGGWLNEAIRRIL